MEALGIQRQPIITVIPAPSVPLPPHFMNPFSAAAARATLFLRSSPSPKFRVFCTSPPPQNSAITLTTTTITTTPQEEKEKVSSKKKKKKNSSSSRTGRVSSSSSDANQQLKVDWLESLTYPFPTKPQPLLQQCDYVESSSSAEYSDESHSHWVIGIDPDVSGALALLKTDHSGSSAQVFDSPHLKVLVGKRIRRRLDTKSIVELLQSFGAPIGTTAYLEQSLPYPQDGKQGWWSGGFGYGLWIGVLVASGYSVIPVPSLLWKNEFKLSGNGSSKDDSRELASALFPSMCSLLKRKKDHGRAEALLIAAYGKGLKINCDDSSCTSGDSVLPQK